MTNSVYSQATTTSNTIVVQTFPVNGVQGYVPIHYWEQARRDRKQSENRRYRIAAIRTWRNEPEPRRRSRTIQRNLQRGGR